MDLKEIRKIVELMNEHELSYFHLEEEGVNIKLKKGADIVQVAQAAMPAAAPAAAPAPASAPSAEAAAPAAPAGDEITAPMVGTFYASPNPESPAFVKVGDTISVGQTLCIIEAMKVMNEIKAEQSGTITAIVANDGEPVQFGDPLFRIQ
ncbi:MAG: acetyl-CoA carboxylase biotin carboxyl carrier protein [Akkermansiaceae bacterium]